MTSMPRSLGCLALLLPALAAAQLPPGISGAWYNPEQSGHGLSVEILDDARALAFWYVYDPQGNPVHLYLDGRIEGRRIEATAYAPRGMRFGSFRRDDLDMPVWGEVALDFSSCDRGLLQWDSDLPEYGSGSSEIRRLTRIAGLDCEFDAQPPTVYALTIDRDVYPDGRGYAARDEQGRLWALETVSAFHPDAIPVTGYVGFPGALIKARPREDASVELSRYSMAPWLNAPSAVSSAAWQAEANGGVLGLQLDNGSSERWQFAPSASPLSQPLTLASLAQNWLVVTRTQFFNLPVGLRIGADGSLCFDLGSDCRYRGTVSLRTGSAGFFEFSLSDTTRSDLPFVGRGWLQGEGDSLRIVLVGDNGPTGIGLVGHR